MALQRYRPKKPIDQGMVRITPEAFVFNAAASKMAGLDEVSHMYVHLDPDDRLVVFEPLKGIDKIADALSLARHKKRDGYKSYRTLTAKGLIRNAPWIKAVSDRNLPREAQMFEMKKYSGPLPEQGGTGWESRTIPWYIQLAPAFEMSTEPNKLDQLHSSVKGIYRYLADNEGEEVVYIGKGSIKDRFSQELERRKWRVRKIEYSILQNDEEAYKWEAWWIERFKEKNNGRRPKFNVQDGRIADSGSV